MVKWGVFFVWCAAARPNPKEKFVVVVARTPNGDFGVFPINSQIHQLAIDEGIEDAYVSLNRARYPNTFGKKHSFVDTTTLWAVNPTRFENPEPLTLLRPDDRERIIAAKDYSPKLKGVYKKWITLEGGLED